MKLFYSNALLTSTMTSTSVTTGTSGASSSSGTAPATTTSSSSQSSLANTIITATAGVLAHLPNPNRWVDFDFTKFFKTVSFSRFFFFAEPSQQWPIRLTVPRIALRWWKLWLPCLSEEAVGVLLIIPTKIKINLHQRTSANPHNSNSNNSNYLRLRFQPQ